MGVWLTRVRVCAFSVCAPRRALSWVAAYVSGHECTKRVVLLMLVLVLVLAGCNPVVLAAKETYDVAADPRSVATQATDTAVEVQIRAALLASPVSGTSGVDVYCR